MLLQFLRVLVFSALSFSLNARSITAFAASVQAPVGNPTYKAAGHNLLELNGEMHWNPTQKVFEGVLRYELGKGKSPLNLALYPNRYLGPQSHDRELSEAYSGGARSADNIFSRENGALFISSAEQIVVKDSRCKKAWDEKAKVRSRKKVKLSFNSSETVASYLSSDKPESDNDCVALELKIVFSPPSSLGNFGVRSEAVMHFSGPIFPLPKDDAFSTEIDFSGLPLVCAQCSKTAFRTQLKYIGFPSPLHFYNEDPLLNYFQVEDIRVGVIGKLSDTKREVIQNLIRQSLIAMPFLKNTAPLSGGVHFLIVDEMLLRNIAMRQPGEIQIGAGFLGVNSFLETYHQAAFERAFLVEMTAQKFASDAPPKSMSDVRQIQTLAQWMTQIQLSEFFKGLDKIKTFSDKLSFIPFFDDISKGKGLVNNTLFLGGEEGPNELDTAPMQAIFPTFTGKEFGERAKWCLAPESYKLLEAQIKQVYEEKISAGDFWRQIHEANGGQCGAVRWNLFLERRSLSERITVSEAVWVKEKHRFLFKRSTDSQAAGAFSHPSDPVVFDFLKFSANKNGSEQEVMKTSGKGDDTVEIETLEVGRHKAKVSGPNTDFSSDRHVYPRNIAFQLAGLRVRYDSREKQIEGQQGVQWRLSGDEYSRLASMVLLKTKDKYYLDSSLSGSLQLEDFVPAITFFKLPYFPKTLPVSLGILTFLDKKTDAWLIGSASLSSVASSVLAPSGLDFTVTWKQSIIKGERSSNFYKVETISTLYVPVANLTTLTARMRIGQSSSVESLGGGTSVPGVAADYLKAKQYSVFREEFSTVLAHDLKVNLGNSIMLEDILVYGAHSFAIDRRSLSPKLLDAQTAQSIQSGFRFFGSLLGSKGQSVSLDLSRGLEKNPKNVVSFSIGALN